MIVRREFARTLERWAVERTDRTIAAIGAVMLIAHLAATVLMPKPGGRVVFGDATHHFVQLRSMVFDRDFDFQNDYLRIYGLQHYEPETNWLFTDLTPTGHVRNYMPIGPALLWAPLYLLVAGVQVVLSFAGLAARPDGFDRVLQMVPGVTGVIASTVAAWVSWRMARRLTDPVSAAVATIAIWLGSSAIYYSLVSPSYSHAGSMLASAWFFAHWLNSRARWSVARAAGAGALAGLATLMRWQDVLFLIIPLFESVRWPVPWPRRLTAAAAIAAAWAIVFSPQMAVWNSLYGHWLAMPQGPSFVQWTSPHPIDVLFSDNHGLFSWTPLIVVSLVGLAMFLARHRAIALPIAAIVLSAWYVNASVADWWAGEAFGARRFLSLFPLFVLGLATWLGGEEDGGRSEGDGSGSRKRDPSPSGRRLAIIGVLVAANWLLLFQYEIFMKGYRDLAPYPTGWVNLWLARFVVPFRVIARWIA